MTPTDETTVAFIAEIGETSRYLAARNDLYASVMIAQAILESDSGQSQLSQKPLYNFFGIKGEYNGQSVTLPTWEDDGKEIPTISMLPFVPMVLWKILYRTMWSFLRVATMSEYTAPKRSYKDATAALTGVYATDTTYGDKLNSIIEQYQLTIYDTY